MFVCMGGAGVRLGMMVHEKIYCIVIGHTVHILLTFYLRSLKSKITE